MHLQNTPVETRPLSANGSTLAFAILPGELHMFFELGNCSLTSDKAGSALHAWEEDGIASMVTAPSTGTTLAVDQNGAQYNAGDIIVIVPFNWQPPNSPLCQDINALKPFPYVGKPQRAVVAAGSTANAVNVTAAVAVNAYDCVYHMSDLGPIKAVGNGTVTWPPPNQPEKPWFGTTIGKTALLQLDGTAAASISYLIATKYADGGNWLG